MMKERISRLLQRRDGHFTFESGHHGQVWLDLELLFRSPERVRPLAAALANRIGAHEPEAICGPLTEGAMLALMVALELRLPFAYSATTGNSSSGRGDTIEYRIPDLLAAQLGGRRVAVVDDVINAGSAVAATMASLEGSGGIPVVIGALAAYGNSARELAAARGVGLEALATFPSRIWAPEGCPLCARGVPLDSQAS